MQEGKCCATSETTLLLVEVLFLMMPYMLAPREWLVAKNQETEEAVGYPKGHPDS